MRRTHLALLSSMAAATLAIAGCPLDFGRPIATGSPTPGPSAFPLDTEKEALGALIDSSAVHPYFEPAKLVNDGVGIFSGDDDGSGLLPRRWGRTYPKTVQSAGESALDDMAIDFRRNRQGYLTAEATFSVQRPARFVADYAWEHRLVTKSYVEKAQRLARFVKRDGIWRLDSLSPMNLSVTDGKVTISQARLSWGSGQSLTMKGQSLIAASDAPVVDPSQPATLEVTASYTGTSLAPVPLYLFLSQPPGRDRILLHDDGLNGDQTANDGIYSVKFDFAATSGLNHLVVDAVSGSTFADVGNDTYDATLWGVSYLVKGGDAQ